MSIRAKILSILMSALVMAFVVSVLSYYNSSRMEDELSEIIDGHLPASRAARSVRGAMERVGSAEERMISVDDASWRAVVEEGLNEARGHIEEGSRGARTTEEEATWEEASAQLRELRRGEVRLADMIATEVREIQGQQRRLEPRMVRLRRALGSLSAELEQEALDLAADGQGDAAAASRYRRAARAGRIAADLLSELEELRYSASRSEVFAADFQRQAIPRRVERLRELLVELREVLAGTAWDARAVQAGAQFRDLAGELEEVSRRVFDVNGRLVAAREDTRLSRERLLLKSDRIERDHLERIEAHRTDLSTRRSQIGGLILGFLMISVLFVGGLATGVLRTVSNEVAALLRASRQLQRGDLEARVQIAGKDELAEVGASFNAMAQYLQLRRKRQNDYNEIVSLLNSSIGVQETIEECLGEIVVRTGSTVGGVYLHDEASHTLALVDQHGLDEKAQSRRTLRVGEGLIGQVARSRRMAVVRPVPPGTLDLDFGVGERPAGGMLVLPMVHLDVLLGVVVLGSSGAYSEEDTRFVEEVVFQMAVAVSNATFYQTIERTAEALRENHDQLIAQQRDLEKANVRLEEANRLKTEFLANVTHELRTPLNSIIGFTDLVLESGKLSARQAKNLQTVLRNAQNLLRLINDLLDISRMESGNITLTLERFELGELVEEAVEVVRPMAGNKHLEVRASLADTLPTLYSDRGKTRQILVNLLSNAVKFTESGEIVVEVEPHSDHVAIRVRDSGIGMRPEDLSVIFEKFRQLDGSTSRKYGGAGLGLAITRQLCNFLGGDVRAASVLGEGSTFSVRLPIVFEGHPEAPAGVVEIDREGAARAPSEWEGEGGRPFVLVLDQDPMTVVALREGLREAGLEVKSAFTGQDAVDILAAFDPVCVVIGSALPDASSAAAMTEVWRRIKADAIPVILIWSGEGELPLYGYPSAEDKQTAGWTSDLSDRTIARVVGRIGRPVRAGELLACIEEHSLRRRITTAAASVDGAERPVGVR